MTHLDNLKKLIPGMRQMKVLDVGSGGGDFVRSCAADGIDFQGIEINAQRVEEMRKEVPAARIAQGIAERLPYPDESFDFINLCEVIEHVRDPKKALEEMFRVLKHGGSVYASFPNRWSIYDTHYHVWFVNLLPRAWADGYIRFIGKAKPEDGVDLQKLSEMHYYTMRSFTRLAASVGFRVEDTRLRKLASRPYLKPLYALMAPWYFRASHTLLTKA